MTERVSPEVSECTCRIWPTYRQLNRECRVHGDKAEADHEVPNVTLRTVNGDRCSFCNRCGEEVWRNAGGEWIHYDRS